MLVFSLPIFVCRSNGLPVLDKNALIAFVTGVTFTTVFAVGVVARTLTRVSELNPTVPLIVTTNGGVKLVYCVN